MAVWIPWSASESPGDPNRPRDAVAPDGPHDLLSNADLAWAERHGFPVLRTKIAPQGVGLLFRAGQKSAPWSVHHPLLHPVRATKALQGFCVDFVQGPLMSRLQSIQKTDGLPRAVGAHRRSPVVFDATAGFGTDAVTLAALGLRVVACETHPVVHRMLADGLRRARDARVPWVRHIELLPPTDACEALTELTTQPDVVLLDPMYPEPPDDRRKSRLPAQLLQHLVGTPEPNTDAQLFASARSAASERVVVKRQASSSPIVDDPPPSHVVRGKSVRFDVYLQTP